MRQALAAGADMINDIYGFRRDGALQAVADSNCGLCIMHMQVEPKTMQQMPCYDDILIEVEGFLRGRVHAALAAGIDRRRTVLDTAYCSGMKHEQKYRPLIQFWACDNAGCTSHLG